MSLPPGFVEDEPKGGLPAGFVIDEPSIEKKIDPTKGMSTIEKTMAGIGKAFVDIGRGVNQATAGMALGGAGLRSTTPGERMILGMDIVPADEAARTYYKSEADRQRKLQAVIDEEKRLSTPLMATGAGFTGNVLGNIAATLPAAFVPGAGTAAGATTIGAILGAAQPTATGESRAANTAIGGISSLAGQQIGSRAIPWMVDKAKAAIANAAAQKTANAARDATLAASRAAGYTLPPSEVNPSAVSNLLERLAGKASVGQQASISNQQVTNKLVRETLGLPENVPITSDALTPIKQAAWSAYDKARNLGTIAVDKHFDDAINEIAKKSTKLNPIPGIDDLVERLKQGSFDSNDVITAIQTFKANSSTRLGPMNLDPVSKNLGKAEASAAKALEDLVERKLGGNALTDFKNARITLGKVGTVERSLVESTGDVSAKKLASQLVKGKPLTGGLRQAAEFAQAFPRFNQMNVNPVPGGSPLDAAVAIGTSAATGNPGWLALALGRPLARNVVLSEMMSRNPNYTPNAIARLIAQVPEIEQAPMALQLGAPSIYATQE